MLFFSKKEIPLGSVFSLLLSVRGESEKFQKGKSSLYAQIQVGLERTPVPPGARWARRGAGPVGNTGVGGNARDYGFPGRREWRKGDAAAPHRPGLHGS